MKIFGRCPGAGCARPPRRDRLATVVATLLQDHLAEARGIARCDVEPRTGHFATTGIEPDIAMVLGTERLPEHLLERRCDRETGDAASDPSEHIGTGVT